MRKMRRKVKKVVAVFEQGEAYVRVGSEYFKIIGDDQKTIQLFCLAPEMEALLYNLSLSDQVGEKEQKQILAVLKKIKRNESRK